MDAIEFVKQLRRMNKNASRKYNIFNDSPEDVVAEVEKWSKEHPRKTRQSVFQEQYPDVVLDEYGVITMCPIPLSSIHRTRDGLCAAPDCICTNCRRKFWMQEVE